jgi:hypothetical protein
VSVGFSIGSASGSRGRVPGPIETALAVESLTLHYEGFVRDTSIVEPKQP